MIVGDSGKWGDVVKKRTRWLLLLLTIGAGSLLPGLSEPPAGCHDWSVHGYWIGMSKAEAGRVRKMRRTRDGWKVKEAKRYRGVLQFDGHGLRRYVAKFSTGAIGQRGSSTAAALELALRDRLGDPTDTIESEQSNVLIGSIRRRALVWQNEACDTLIALEAATAGDSTATVTQPVLYLRRLSDWRKNTRTLLE